MVALACYAPTADPWRNWWGRAFDFQAIAEQPLLGLQYWPLIFGLFDLLANMPHHIIGGSKMMISYVVTQMSHPNIHVLCVGKLEAWISKFLIAYMAREHVIESR